MSKDLIKAVNMLYDEELEEITNYGVDANVIFSPRERCYRRILDIFCGILYDVELVKNVKYSTFTVYRLCKAINNLFNLYIMMHNHFVIADLKFTMMGKYLLQNEQKKSLKDFLYNLNRPVSSSVKNIECFCAELISGSDFMREEFVFVAACLDGICFYSNKIRKMFTMNARKKDYQINVNSRLSCSLGISVKDFIPMDCSQSEQYKDFSIYKDKLKLYCSVSIQRYHNFLLEGLHDQHGICFEGLLSDVAKVFAKTSREKFFPQKALFLCDGKLLVSSSLTRHGIEFTTSKRQREYDAENNDPFIVHKKFCSSKNSSDDVSVPQQSCSNAAFLAGGEGTSLDFDGNGAVLPQQSCSQVASSEGESSGSLCVVNSSNSATANAIVNSLFCLEGFDSVNQGSNQPSFTQL
ncbi:hypothetical protein K6025_05085 [Ehrlichia sp. JZT12]